MTIGYADGDYLDSGYSDSGYFGLTVVAETYPDLPAAIIARLRVTPAVVAAFGEDTTTHATTKFWADVTPTKVDLPWATYEETGSEFMYMTGDPPPAIETGQLRFIVVAEGKKEARDLSRLLAETLNDAPLVFDDGLLMNLRAKTPFFVPIGNILPGATTGYSIVLVFDFMCQRAPL